MISQFFSCLVAPSRALVIMVGLSVLLPFNHTRADEAPSSVSSGGDYILVGGGLQMNDPVSIPHASVAPTIASLQINTDHGATLAKTDANPLTLAVPRAVLITLAGQGGGPGTIDGSGTNTRFGQIKGLAADSAGNLYAADTYNHTIRKITPAGVVTTLAGHPGQSGHDDGPAKDALFYYPAGVAVDAADNVYVAEHDRIRKISASGQVSTYLEPGNFKFINLDIPPEHIINFRLQLSIDGQNAMYAMTGDGKIYKIDPDRNVSVLAGGGVAGLDFSNLHDMAADATGNVYIYGDDALYKISGSGGAPVLLADGILEKANLAPFPLYHAMGLDGDGNVYLGQANSPGVVLVPSGTIEGGIGPGIPVWTSTAIPYRNALLKVTPSGSASLIYDSAPDAGTESQRQIFPGTIAVPPSGDVYMAEPINYRISRMTPGETPIPFVGKPVMSGTGDGDASIAQFTKPEGISVGPGGIVYVEDTQGVAPPVQVLRKILANGTVETVRDDNAAPAPPSIGVAIDAAGNRYSAHAANTSNLAGHPALHAYIEKTPDGGGQQTPERMDFTGGRVIPWYSAVYYPHITTLSGMVASGSNIIYATSETGHVIYKIIFGSHGEILAGEENTAGAGDGTSGGARFNGPTGISMDAAGLLYVADTGNATIRRIDPATGRVTTIIGTPWAKGGIDGFGNAAFLAGPRGIHVDAKGDGLIYITDTADNTVRVLQVAPEVVEQPAAQTVTRGAVATLTARVAAAPHPSYQWHKNGSPVVGGTNGTLVINNAQAGHTGDYSVTATNILGSVTSDTVALIVTDTGGSPSGGDANGGGGAPALPSLALLAALLALRARKK